MAVTLLAGGLFTGSASAEVSTITLTSPNGGEVWNGIHPITWTTTGGVPGDLVNIAYSTDGFNFSSAIALGVPYNLPFSWNTASLPDGTTYWIRVLSPSSITYDTSDLPFTIDNTAPTFTINNGTATGPVQTDIINVTVDATVSGLGSSEYGFSPDSTCDVSDTYGNPFSSGLDFPIADNHTDFLCVKATDLATNVGYALVGQLNTDNTAPTLVSAVTVDYTHINVTFSEDLNGATVTNADFAVAGNTLVAPDAFEISPGVVQLTLGTAIGAADTPLVTVNGPVVEDLAGNQMLVPASIAPADGIAPTIFESVAVPTPDNDNTPDYTFGSDEVGWITYGGDCSSVLPIASVVFNTITFNPLTNGNHTNCTLTVTDVAGNTSNLLSVSAFFVDTVAPTVNAGTDKIVNATVFQDATTSDSAPSSGIVTRAWTQESGPLGGIVTFGSASTEDTTLAADTDGTYTIRLTVTDAAGNVSLDEMILVWDTIPPTLAEVFAVSTPTNDNTPAYTFSSDEAGSLSYGGGCSGVTTSAVAGNNPINFGPLADGIYNCTLIVTDAATNPSLPLAVSTFQVDIVAPLVNAGGDKEVNATVFQDATTSDPIPASGIVTWAWTQQFGPGTAVFGSGSSEDTTISADVDGTYTIRLTVTDAAGNSAYDEMILIWDTVAPVLVFSIPNDSATGVSIADANLSAVFNEDVVLNNVAQVNLVENSTSTTHLGVVSVQGGDGNSAVLLLPYTGLTNSTLYRANIFPAAVRDVAGNVFSQSEIIYFTTVAPTGDVTSPTVVNQTPADNSTGISIAVSPVVTFSEPMNPDTVNSNTVKLKKYSDDSEVSATYLLDDAHTGVTLDPVSSLEESTQYYLWVSGAKDVAGNTVVAYTTQANQEFTTGTAPDITPPVITDVQVVSIGQTDATVTWTTDEPSDSEVEYGLSSSYGSSEVDATLTPVHIVNLTGLTAGTLYHFRVNSTDGSANLSVSTDNVFTTSPSTTDVSAPIITDIQVVSISSVSATVTWTTDEGSSSQVEYGPTSSYGSLTSLDATLVTGHSVDLTGLIPGITYHFRVKSADVATNLAVSGDQVFDTAPANNPPVVPGVTNITAVKTFAIADGTYANGWEWVFEATLPVSEASVSMKFADWVSGSNTIPAASNIRYFSSQSSDVFDETTASVIGAADTYGDPMNMNADLDLSKVGRQVQIHVQVKVPVGSAAGSYSTSYGIKSS
ncbi:MAG: Ig-like domain-containing protein [Patescibacteria group bacterium]